MACLRPMAALAQLEITVHPDYEETLRQEVNDVAGNTSLVNEHAWSNQRAATVKDITDYIAGVISQPRNGAESARLSIRGSGLANIFQGRGLLVLQDGIPINMADGSFEFPVIDPWLIRYAQVFPAANAIEYGASNFGGAINFITPTGDSKNGYDIRAEGGSFGTAHALTSTSQRWHDNDLFAAASGFSQGGFRHQNRQETRRFNANWGWQPSAEFSNRFYINHTHSDAEIPGAISLANIKSNPKQANPNNVSGDYQRNLDITRIGNKSVWQHEDERVETTVFYTTRSLDNPVTTYEFEDSHDVGIRAKYTHYFGDSHWLVGINNTYGRADETRYQNLAGNPGTLTVRRDLYALTSEAYAQIEQHLRNKWYAITGIQTSYSLRNIEQGFPSIARQNEHYIGISPSIGLRYDISKDSQLFTNLSRSFEPPSWGELSAGNSAGFNKRKAQRADSFELGARGLSNNIHWQAAYYHGWVRNEFVNYRFANGDTATINAPRSKRDGVELALEGDAGYNLSLRGAYTFSYFTLDNDPLYGNKRLPGVPEHFLRSEMLYHLSSGFAFGPNVEWSPMRQPVDITNSFFSPAYALAGARAFWESEDKNHSFYVEGRNLLDTRTAITYNVSPDVAGADGRYFFPAEGRSLTIGFRWKL